MEQKRSLTPAQIQYLKIGPKVFNSTVAVKQLQDNLDQYHIQGAQPGASLAKISKFTFGNFQNTVNNFGVLLNRNFIGPSSLHQKQKFGNIAVQMDKIMLQQKDRIPVAKGGQRKSYNDARIALKGVCDIKGHKLMVNLKSFSIESISSHRILQTLQIPFLKLLVNHVSSSKLIKAIELSMKQQGSTITIDYQKMQSKICTYTNNQLKYQQTNYIFEKGNQQLQINLPYLQIYHGESQFKKNYIIENKDIISIIDSDFDNTEEIVKKYLDMHEFEQFCGKTGVDQSSIPLPDYD